MQKKYPILFEVASNFAMFARPDSGSEACSYVIPPPTACKGIIESICRIQGIEIDVLAVGLCKIPSFSDYCFNSHSPFRKGNTIKDGNPCQVRNTVLLNPIFQILAVASNNRLRHVGNDKYVNNNNAHSFQHQFFRRLKKGRSFRSPCLGWSQFGATYFGLPITPIVDYDYTIRSMPCLAYDEQGNLKIDDDKKIEKNVLLNVEIKKGLAIYDKSYSLKISNNKIAFSDSTLQTSLEGSM